jgi:integrase
MSSRYSSPRHPAGKSDAATVSREKVPVEPVVPARPKRPYPNYPLRPHALGYWCKQIRRRVHYFGRIEDGPEAALKNYLDQRDDLLAGRTPRSDHDRFTVVNAVDAFLHEKKAKVEAGELAERSWLEYKRGCDEIISAFGKRRRVADLGPEDFASLRKRLAAKFGVVRLGNIIQTVRSVFKFCYESDLLDRPMRFGPSFKKPSAKTMRLHKAKQGEKLFSADEIMRMLDAADPQLRAQILLGINCAFGMADCGRLPITALDLDGGWLTHPRVKTGVARKCSLWPESIAALRAALASRPTPRDKADNKLVFLTAQGRPWDRETSSGPGVFKVAKLLKRLKIKRPGRAFYTLRHTFRTIADECKDQPACDFVMGHTNNTMAAVYRERISDDRLKAVSDYVRAWLFPTGESKDEPRIIRIG